MHLAFFPRQREGKTGFCRHIWVDKRAAEMRWNPNHIPVRSTAQGLRAAIVRGRGGGRNAPSLMGVSGESRLLRLTRWVQRESAVSIAALEAAGFKGVRHAPCRWGLGSAEGSPLVRIGSMPHSAPQPEGCNGRAQRLPCQDMRGTTTHILRSA